MTVRFDPHDGPILLTALLVGPGGQVTARMMLDTGATGTIISSLVLQTIGYDPEAAEYTVRLTTASGVEEAPVVRVGRIVALGKTALGLAIACHTLPARARVDGVLGLDSLRGYRLVVDFREGFVSLE